MTEEKATEARRLLNAIHNMEYVIDSLKKEREARATGLDHTAPGPKRHVLDVLDKEWHLVGEWCVDFFITAMDTVIRNTEAELSDLRKQLENL